MWGSGGDAIILEKLVNKDDRLIKHFALDVFSFTIDGTGFIISQLLTHSFG